MNTKLFPILFLSIALAGCASWCKPNDTQCQQDMQNADLVAGAAVGVAAILEAPPTPQPTTTTETRTCSTDFWGNKTCTTTTQEH